MNSRAVKTAQPGRPPRPKYAAQQTRLWAQAVRDAVWPGNLKELESTLGFDGKWNGLWSRYWPGTVSPPLDRIGRIESVFPGTAKYYLSPFWSLTEDRFYSRQELDECIAYLCPILKQLILASAPGVFGRRWRSEAEDRRFLLEAVRLIRDRDRGFDAVTAILIAIREAELIQDSAAYLRACQAWAAIETDRGRHAVLRYLSPYLLDDIAEPLRHMRFFPKDIDDLWRGHVASYCESKNVGANKFEVLDCVLQLQI